MLSHWQFCRQAAWTSQVPRHQRWCKSSTRPFIASDGNRTSDPIPSGRILHAIADRDDPWISETQPSKISSRLEHFFSGIATEEKCKRMCFVGIDPDIGGALASISMHEDADLSSAVVEVSDTPVVFVPTGDRVRRQIDPGKVTDLLEMLKGHNPGVIKAFLEKPLPLPINGSFSNHQSGISFGVWHGSLCANRIDTNLVWAAKWKRDMDLFGKPKEGSIEKAIELFPAAAHYFQREKDHGRAEALLIAYWGMKYGAHMENNLTPLNQETSKKFGADLENNSTSKQSQKSKRAMRVRVCDEIFPSTGAVVEAGLAESADQVRRRVRSDSEKWKEWIRC